MRRALAAAADLVLRRRPLTALAVLLAAGAVVPVDTPFTLLALVPLYGAAVNRPWRVAGAGAAGVVAADLVHHALWGSRGGAAEVAATAGLAIVVVAVGSAVRERRGGAARERALLAERAVAEERLRIARDLHDAVGHDVSLMVVQAQALGATNADEGVRAATAAIADAGRRAMAEMHRTLQVLREGDTGDGDAVARAPQPGLAALDDVLDGARAAGVTVRIAMEGAARPLDPALDASAFRIVQEAVTNVVRHAGGAPATVTVRYGPAALEVLVTDDGPRRATPRNGTGAGGGHGLVGMRERAAMFGGTLSAGPRDGHGFEVRAVLPYPDAEAAP
jgi:signal transduction histidine kinase